MAFTLMQGVRGSTFREGETCRSGLCTFINRRMLTITRLLTKSLRGEGLERPSGRLSSIATTSLHRPMTRKRRRFWYMHRRIDHSRLPLQPRQNSKSVENRNCLGMPALLVGFVNTGIGRTLTDSATKSSFRCILKFFTLAQSAEVGPEASPDGIEW